MVSTTSQLSRAQELERDRIVSDLEAVLRFPQGKRTLLRILERCGVFRTAFTGEDSATDFRLGEQNIGLFLIAQIELVGPTEFPRLLLEAAQEKDRKEETVHVLDDDPE